MLLELILNLWIVLNLNKFNKFAGNLLLSRVLTEVFVRYFAVLCVYNCK